tara:strand:- start:103 stop:678 length:576 start_codon:yes stop_codon:yes gene_type:complete
MPLSSSINGFLSNIGQGVKPNMFEVEILFPDGQGDQTVNLLCKSTALPGSSLGSIDVPFRGRTVKIVGDRTFDNWSATFFNDKEMKIRSKFESWMQQMNTHEGNTAPLFLPETGGGTGYMQTLKVKQLEKNDQTPGGSELRTYTLWHAFPISISQIDLAYDSNDQIEEFSVEFQMSYWTVEDGGVSGTTIA